MFDRHEQYAHEDYHNRVMHRRTAASHAAFFLPNLRPDMSLIDCGCGPGSITIGLAKVVAPGLVAGIDVGEYDVQNARSLAIKRGLSNVEFHVASVYQIPYPDNTFDAAFASGLLEHLQEPLNALKEIHRVLKHGGLVGVRSPDYGGHVYAPTNPVIDDSLALIEQLVEVTGGNRRIGRHLRAMLRRTGFVNIEASASFESNGTPEITRFESDVMAGIFAEGPYHDRWIELEWEDDSTLQNMASAWRVWGDHPDAFRASMWCEAIGRKE